MFLIGFLVQPLLKAELFVDFALKSAAVVLYGNALAGVI